MINFYLKYLIKVCSGGGRARPSNPSTVQIKAYSFQGVINVRDTRSLVTDSILNLNHKIEPILRFPQDARSCSFCFYCVLMFIQERINEESVFGNLTRKNMTILIDSKKFYSRSKYGAKVRAQACGA